jgi:hypothetical protein
VVDGLEYIVELATVVVPIPVNVAVLDEDVDVNELVAPVIVRPLDPVIKPNTFNGLVVPDVPTLTVCPFADVSPAFALINPDADTVVNELFAPVIVNPFVPVIKPNTFRGLVVPVVPTLTVCPVALVNPAFALINPDAESVVTELFAPLTAKPFVPVIKPNTLSGLVVPEVPTFTVCPVNTVIPALAFINPEATSVVKVVLPLTTESAVPVPPVVTVGAPAIVSVVALPVKVLAVVTGAAR